MGERDGGAIGNWGWACNWAGVASFQGPVASMMEVMRSLAMALVMLITSWTSVVFGDEPSTIKSDEVIEFFPTAARLTDDGQTWIVPIHGWIYEPEAGDLLRGALVDSIRGVLLDASPAERKILDQRLRRFLVDNERRKRVEVEIAGQRETLPASSENGHFHDTIAIPAQRAGKSVVNGQLRLRAVLSEDDPRTFEGRITLLSPAGITVISDIDDTVKVTEVTSGRGLWQKTFLEEFEAVPGMSSRYSRWSDEGAHVHYLSGSPWQLHQLISEMLSREGFPAGSTHLRSIRFKDSSVMQLLQPPDEFKTIGIEATFARWPNRRYVLVGDSGEHDPEIYGEIARRFPERVLYTAIRDVTSQARDADRYRTAFRNVPGERWMIFTDPERLPSLREVQAIGASQ